MNLFSEDGILYQGPCIIILEDLQADYVRYLFIRKDEYTHMSAANIKYILCSGLKVIDMREK